VKPCICPISLAPSWESFALINVKAFHKKKIGDEIGASFGGRRERLMDSIVNL